MKESYMSDHIRRRGRAVFMVTAAGALAVVGVVASAVATPPGQNGDIAFRRYLGPGETKGTIFMAARDGTGERQLTKPPARASDDYPDVAADGSFVAFNAAAG
jgi:TolB protein